MIAEITGGLPNPGGILQQQRNHIRWMEQVYRARNQWEKDKLPDPQENVKKRLDQKTVRANAEETTLL